MSDYNPIMPNLAAPQEDLVEDIDLGLWWANVIAEIEEAAVLAAVGNMFRGLGATKQDISATRYLWEWDTNKTVGDLCDLTCSICLSPLAKKEKMSLKQVVTLPCHHLHIFHGRCIHQWLERSNTCPNGRCSLPPVKVGIAEELRAAREERRRLMRVELNNRMAHDEAMDEPEFEDEVAEEQRLEDYEEMLDGDTTEDEGSESDDNMEDAVEEQESEEEGEVAADNIEEELRRMGA